MLFVQLLFNGLQIGSFYALTAAGFALIFGSTRVFHVAHGACFVLSGYVFYYCFELQGMPWWLATIATIFAAAMFGICIEKFVYRPIQRHEASFFTVFIASFGVALIVQRFWTPKLSQWVTWIVVPILILVGARFLWVALA